MSIGILGTGVRVLRTGDYGERSPNESGEEHHGSDSDSDNERVSTLNDSNSSQGGRFHAGREPAGLCTSCIPSRLGRIVDWRLQVFARHVPLCLVRFPVS